MGQFIFLKYEYKKFHSLLQLCFKSDVFPLKLSQLLILVCKLVANILSEACSEQKPAYCVNVLKMNCNYQLWNRVIPCQIRKSFRPKRP